MWMEEEKVEVDAVKFDRVWKYLEGISRGKRFFLNIIYC